MSNVQLFNEDSGGCCFLEVRSGPFSAAVNFYFDKGPWKSFLEGLDILDRTLEGVARLGQDFEEPYIELRGRGRGRVVVQGLLLEQSENSQRLEFSFETDQTVLGPFLEELRNCGRTAQ